MSKYDALEDYLRGLQVSSWRASFDQIENVLKTKLPNSAHKYQAWWSNNPSNSVMTKSWLRAGWKTEQVDVPGQAVTFRKVGQRNTESAPETKSLHGFADADTAYAAPPVRESKAGQSRELVIRDAAKWLFEVLEKRAVREGRTPEDVAVRILAAELRHDPDSVFEKLRRIRAMSPPLPADVDIAAMIREDRDSR